MVTKNEMPFVLLFLINVLEGTHPLSPLSAKYQTFK